MARMTLLQVKRITGVKNDNAYDVIVAEIAKPIIESKETSSWDKEGSKGKADARGSEVLKVNLGERQYALCKELLDGHAIAMVDVELDISVDRDGKGRVDLVSIEAAAPASSRSGKRPDVAAVG